MNREVVCDSADVRIAYNKIERYTDFLVRQMEEYIKVLAQVQNNAVSDNLINAALSQLAAEIKPCIADLDCIIKDSFKMTANREVSEIAAADTFQFPNELLAHISSLLARFL